MAGSSGSIIFRTIVGTRRLVTVTVYKFKIAVTIFEISKHENVGYKN
jgi:hypothetical protein